jgi:hypothetical protein
MKLKTIKMLALGLAATAVSVSAFAQGQVNFFTYNSSVATRGNIYLPGGTQGVGVGYVAQLWVYSSSSLANMIALSPLESLTVNGGGAIPGGTVNAGVINIPLTLDPAYDPVSNPSSAYDAGSKNYFIIRVWNAAAGSTWAAALASANLTAFGTSAIFNVNTGGTDINGDAPIAPPNLNNFANFSLTAVPEPTTLALAGLGGFGMLMALRRKQS